MHRRASRHASAHRENKEICSSEIVEKKKKKGYKKRNEKEESNKRKRGKSMAVNAIESY